MPARRDLTIEDVRLQARDRKRRQRERERNAGHGTAVTGRSNGHGTVAPENGRLSSIRHVTPAPPQTPPSPSISLEIEKIKTLLEPFTARGYEHDPAFWELMAAEYPRVALRVEAYNMASWLKKPLKKNRDALCNTGFIINWLKKAQADVGTPRVLPPTSSSYHGGNGQKVDPPIAFQPNRQPPDDSHPLKGPLLPISKEEFQRTLDANRGLPLEQKLARLNGRLKGGKT